MTIKPIKGSKQEVFGRGDISKAITEAEWLTQYKEVMATNGNPITIAPTSAATIYGHNVSDLQSNITINGSKILGTLKYVETGTLPEHWNNHYFLALSFETFPENATSVTVELVPSQGSKPVELIEISDRNDALSIDQDLNGKPYQKIVLTTTTPEEVKIQTFLLSELVLEPEQN